jgi:hypothetical protein
MNQTPPPTAKPLTEAAPTFVRKSQGGTAVLTDYEREIAARRWYEGATAAELASTYSVMVETVRKWAIKYDWKRKLPAGSQSVPLHERVQMWHHGQVTDLEESFETICALPRPKSREEAKEHEQLMTMHLDRGRKIFGLDQQQGGPNTIVNVAVLSALGAEVARTQDGHKAADILRVQQNIMQREQRNMLKAEGRDVVPPRPSYKHIPQDPD